VIEEVIADLAAQMKSTEESLKRDLSHIRTGRANPALLDGIMVDYYGAMTPLNKLASVSAPEARLLVVQPFDQSAVGAMEKAIQASGLGLSPVSDGRVLRVPIPELTEERRRDLVKQVRREGENHRVAARNHRRDANEMLRELQTEKEITEDENRRAQEKIEELTKTSMQRLDDIVKAKEKEVMSV
jgi:ribosome recycling factor